MNPCRHTGAHLMHHVTGFQSVFHAVRQQVRQLLHQKVLTKAYTDHVTCTALAFQFQDVQRCRRRPSDVHLSTVGQSLATRCMQWHGERKTFLCMCRASGIASPDPVHSHR